MAKGKVKILRVLSKTAGKNHVWCEAIVDGVKMKIRKTRSAIRGMQIK